MKFLVKFSGLVGWLAGWLVGWLAGWLVGAPPLFLNLPNLSKY
ncbi:hypothetical protein [Campylobacter concisus]|nr:hypothetical protein [Campylobacter concisus]